MWNDGLLALTNETRRLSLVMTLLAIDLDLEARVKLSDWSIRVPLSMLDVVLGVSVPTKGVPWAARDTSNSLYDSYFLLRACNRCFSSSSS